ncbi:MAG: M23 family metallopeptidase [Microbacterium sp.]
MDTTCPIRRIIAALVVAIAIVVLAPPTSAVATGSVAHTAVTGLEGWRWPVAPPQIVAPFVAPAHAYGAGHRGIDLAAAVDAEVVSPAGGVVAFAGTVVDRPLVTIDHGDGFVTTLEPVLASVAIGDVVEAGTVVGTVGTGGHAAVGSVHFGVRENGTYINPMLLLGVVERAILLPCC